METKYVAMIWVYKEECNFFDSVQTGMDCGLEDFVDG